ncbi:hypothetical protein GCM10011529_13250 [Polymorphobacter glacialis]|uniref:Uncharacterized protein n=1 Tax=Sandarakinorhabdus glacialis TaxID=1614636 RepID=A0A916ZPS9_9SPHN|nr:hypothetical protein [Polymorphobacter glacialis]GGE08166.1 hypothetical protein GCM10011529_13250 [Polymorphobacter glacialis]
MNASTGVDGNDRDARASAPAPGKPRPQLWRRWWFWLPLLLCLLAGGWFGLKFSSTGQRADLAAGYIAHVVCSCRYVGNRDMASCKTDFEPGTEIVRVEDDTAKRRITASVPLLSRRTAAYDPEYGCALDLP